ncbi:cobalt-precorrin-6A reductase [Cohaesibacter gelatinilyticus]|uniref:Precorrin-6A reductase n=1 Tax=Cohaesibacter gelatinilyticus TaxID=372072 RepID=A0A285NDC8_9HYPH|nr:cobalt-precorrin-6A reductase [Cohaesibacter gelatinilyticus]SNZ07460.1 precorrin-6A reductase [Cohaesibacter gelatinilyticus]HAT88153.1 cobalt-precorrin-6A reductase [Hyphomicrobiales bacterium]
MTRILLLGGTTEARELEAKLTEFSEFEVIVSLAGRTQAARSGTSLNPTDATRHIGGFGGVEGLKHFLVQEDINIILDATHPFANQISWNVVAANEELALPILRIERSAWQWQAGDKWVRSPDLTHAVDALTSGKRYLLAIGRQEAHQFARRGDCWFLSRSIEALPTEYQIPNGQQILYQPDGDLDAECDLLAKYSLDGVICKNSGGESGYAKILAARELGLIVHIIERPNSPDQTSVDNIDTALLWISNQSVDKTA